MVKMPCLMSDSNPWKGMDGDTESLLFVRNVSKELNTNGLKLYWTAQNGIVGLMLEYSERERPVGVPPRFKGIRVGEDRGRHSIIIELMDTNMREAFLAICEDILEQLAQVSPEQARKAFVLRVQRWGILFQGNHSRLGQEAQKGLIGELKCMSRLAIPYCGQTDAMASWTGPEHGVHDFTFGATSVEVKTNRGSGTPKITNSSENQLAVGEGERLYLYVMGVMASPDVGLTLPEYVEEARGLFESPMDRMAFDLKLARLGYADTDEYQERWGVGCLHVYRVIGDFPRITSDMINPSISGVAYKVDLSHCSKFEIEEQMLLEELEGVNG